MMRNLLDNSNLFLILANGETNGSGFWLIDTTSNEYPLTDDPDLIECHRKELIGSEASIIIINAIKLNLENIFNDLTKEGFTFEIPPKGISYSLPLSLLEKIFDFWLEIYKEQVHWETCLGLLKIKKRCPLSNLIMNNAIKGNAKQWAPKIEELHKYRPVSCSKSKQNEPMWK